MNLASELLRASVNPSKIALVNTTILFLTNKLIYSSVLSDNILYVCGILI